MMSIKLAFANVRKSFKDYLMYFITLTFSVALFYIFGSVDQQLSLIKILRASDGIVANFDSFILGFSILVFIIFYFLVRYANNFLVKRRNQEFATYILLGMRNRTMAVILVIETLVIGVVSLIVGLIMGVALSQVTSVFTTFVLESDIEFSFIYSQAAFKNTIIDFSIIFYSCEFR
ncbi:FtsX-like permease family protein [Erysipelothrix sp. D19-032]